MRIWAGSACAQRRAASCIALPKRSPCHSMVLAVGWSDAKIQRRLRVFLIIGGKRLLYGQSNTPLHPAPKQNKRTISSPVCLISPSSVRVERVARHASWTCKADGAPRRFHKAWSSLFNLSSPASKTARKPGSTRVPSDFSGDVAGGSLIRPKKRVHDGRIDLEHLGQAPSRGHRRARVRPGVWTRAPR